MKGISHLVSLAEKRHTHRSITVWEAITAPFESACVNEHEFSPIKSFGERECNSKVVRWTMWKKMVIGTSVRPVRERVLRADEWIIFKIASFISLPKLSQFQFIQHSRSTAIRKHSRRHNGSRRMESSDVPFIHWADFGIDMCLREMDLTKDWMTGFWTRNLWISSQDWSFSRVTLENSNLRIGWRNEEETREHRLSKSVSSSPTAAITLSMISCGILIDENQIPTGTFQTSSALRIRDIRV